MTTTNIAEVLKLAAKPIQYDNEKTWLEFHFKLENFLILVDEIRGARAECRVSPNIESHTARLAGDTDHETGAKSAEQKWVRSVETDGSRERAGNRGSEIRDAASEATAWNEW